MIRTLSILAAVAALAVSAAPASAPAKPSTQGQSAVANHTEGTVSVMFTHGDFSS